MNLLLMAVAPVLVILMYIYIHDKYDKEPPALLLGSFLLGAVVSVVLVFLLYFIFGNFTRVTDSFSIDA